MDRPIFGSRRFQSRKIRPRSRAIEQQAAAEEGITAAAPSQDQSLLTMSDRKAAGDDIAEPEPEPKRRRRLLLDAGGPIDDDETARQKMRDAEVMDEDKPDEDREWAIENELYKSDGFDPDNVRDIKDHYGTSITPMGYFALMGDLPMMRWLCVNGADTRDFDIPSWDSDFVFPMFSAAVRGQLDACMWLFEHGAAADIKRTSSAFRDGRPLSVVFSHRTGPLPSVREVGRWLIVRGALCKDGTAGKLDIEMMREDLNRPDIVYSWPEQGPIHYTRASKERRLLLEWANDLHRARNSFLLLMSGALPDCRYSSPVKALSGKSGVLELIGDFAGIIRGREARIVRQLTELLPAINKELDAMHSE